MNKTELVEAIVAKTGATKSTVAEIVAALEDIVVTNVCKGEDGQIRLYIMYEHRQLNPAKNIGGNYDGAAYLDIKVTDHAKPRHPPGTPHIRPCARPRSSRRRL